MAALDWCMAQALIPFSLSMLAGVAADRAARHAVPTGGVRPNPACYGQANGSAVKAFAAGEAME